MSAPMLYYLIDFPLFVLGYYTPSENVDAMTNILIGSFAPVLTGIIFGAAFLSVARILQIGSNVRNHMIIAAYGFLLFYIAGSATASQAGLSSIWTSLSSLYWVIMLSYIYRPLFFSSYSIPRYIFTQINKKICERAIKVA